KRGIRRASAERLETQSPRASEQIERVGSLRRRSQQVEHRLAHALFHRPSARVATILQFTTTVGSPNNAEQPNRVAGRLVGRTWSHRGIGLVGNNQQELHYQHTQESDSCSAVCSLCCCFSSVLPFRRSPTTNRNRRMTKLRRPNQSPTTNRRRS